MSSLVCVLLPSHCGSHEANLQIANVHFNFHLLQTYQNQEGYPFLQPGTVNCIANAVATMVIPQLHHLTSSNASMGKGISDV